MILMAYRHGLRASEVGRPKMGAGRFRPGRDPRQPPQGWHAGNASPDRPGNARTPQAQARQRASRFLFVSERGAPMTPPGFNRMIKRAGVPAKLGIKAHAHMLRHACGFKLANDGIDTRSLQAYLGHSNIQNTARYTACVGPV